MNILQINTSDGHGGAEKVALNLHSEYRLRGHNACLAVGKKFGDDPNVLSIDNEARGTLWAKAWTSVGTVANAAVFSRTRGSGRVRHVFERVAHPRNMVSWWRGREHFEFPASRNVTNIFGTTPDIIQAHNLHGGYFDLSALQHMSFQNPTVLTLHDAWLLSGHCAHSFDCKRWEIGCGNCPDLSIYPAIRKDATAENWLRKKQIFNHSKLYISTPSQWLMDKVDRSMLSESVVAKRVIPNGVDLSVFAPTDQTRTRKKLGIPVESFVAVFAANGIRNNIWKDYETLRTALRLIQPSANDSKMILIAVGEVAPPEQIGNVIVNYVPYQNNPKLVADYYNAADVYIHAAKADTFPSTIVEALACGTPVIATSVGGIPEQIIHGSNGFLTRQGDARDIAEKVQLLMRDHDTLLRMSGLAAKNASEHFDLRQTAYHYLDWFDEIRDSWLG